MEASAVYYLPRFSHIYVEKNAFSYELTKSILDKFSDAIVIEIEDYKDIFNRGGQDFQEQKKSTKLILAVKKENFLYDGSEAAPDFGYKQFFYNTPALNCVYNCDYCYLQGMYSSANLVLFVNWDDFFHEAEKKLTEEVYLCISYDTDLLAMESFFPIASEWIGFAANHPNLLLEIRTKSANYNKLKHLNPTQNVILAWTLSPSKVIELYEKRTPRLKERLKSVAQAIEDGWSTRICLDPIIALPGWQELYKELVDQIFDSIPLKKIRDVSIGTFRMNAEYLKKIKKKRMDSDILYFPYDSVGKIKTYSVEIEQEIRKTITGYLAKHIPESKIYYQSLYND